MKLIKNLTAVLLAALFLSGSAVALAGDAKDGKKEKSKAKPYPLKTCVVSDEDIKSDGAMTPYTFVHEGQEVTLCCKSCLKDFNKDTGKYMKKIAKAEKKAK